MADDLTIQMGLTEKQYLQQLARVEASTVRAARGAERAFERSNRSTVRGFNQVNSAAKGSLGGLRQVSMQLSQVAQQGAVTGNYIQALATQLPDLALGFGPLGILIGAAAGSLATLGVGMLGVNKAAEDIDLEGAYKSAASAVDAAREAQDRYTAAINLTGAAQAAVTPQILQSLSLEAQAREALAALEVARMERQKAALEKSLAANREAFNEIIRSAETAASVGAFNITATDEQKEARAAEFRAAAIKDNEDLVLKISEQAAELDLVNALLAQNNGEASEMIDKLVEASKTGAEIASSVSGIDFSNAVAGAQQLSAQLGISLHQAMQIMGLVGAAAAAAAEANAPVVFDPRDPKYDPVKAEMARLSEGAGTVSPFDPSRIPRAKTAKKGGGSKSGKQDDEMNKLLRERDALLLSLETATDKYAREVAELNLLQEKGLLTSDQYAKAMARLDEELINAEFGEVISKIDDVADAIANAIVNGENLGDTFKSILKQIAAEIISSNIRNLLMQTFSVGRGGGGLLGNIFGALFGGGRATGGPVHAGMAYDTQEHGGELFIPAVNGRIVSSAETRDAIKPGRGGQSTARVVFENTELKLTDGGQIMAVVRASSRQATDAAVGAVRNNLRGWQGQLQQDGAL